MLLPLSGKEIIDAGLFCYFEECSAPTKLEEGEHEEVGDS